MALQEVTESNSHALFAYAIVTIILALAFARVYSSKTASTSIEDMISFFRLLQGFGAVNHVSGAHLSKRRFSALWDLESGTNDIVELRLDIMTALDALVRRVENYDTPDRAQVYLSSIERLKHIFRRLKTLRNLRQITAWPSGVQIELLEYLLDSDPMARMIFLHYGVLLLLAHDRWWAKGFGVRLVQNVAASLRMLSSDWAPLTEWVEACATRLVETAPAPKQQL